MSNPKRCICKGRPLNELIAPCAARQRETVARGLRDGQPADFQKLAMTTHLARALSEGRPWAFNARFDSYDHHLAECPCSPRFTPPAP